MGAILKVLDTREAVCNGIENQLVRSEATIAPKQDERADLLVLQRVEKELLSGVRLELFEPMGLLILLRLRQQVGLLRLGFSKEGFQHLGRLSGRPATLTLDQFSRHRSLLHEIVGAAATGARERIPNTLLPHASKIHWNTSARKAGPETRIWSGFARGRYFSREGCVGYTRAFALPSPPLSPRPRSSVPSLLCLLPSLLCSLPSEARENFFGISE